MSGGLQSSVRGHLCSESQDPLNKSASPLALSPKVPATRNFRQRWCPSRWLAFPPIRPRVSRGRSPYEKAAGYSSRQARVALNTIKVLDEVPALYQARPSHDFIEPPDTRVRRTPPTTWQWAHERMFCRDKADWLLVGAFDRTAGKIASVREDLLRVEYRWLTAPAEVDDNLSSQLVNCWWEVSSAGGAVGFPFLPVDQADVAAALDHLVQSLDPASRTLLVAMHGNALLGWLVLECNPSRLTAHWARVLRVQTTLAARASGVGRALMSEVARIARDDLGLEQLHIEVRGGKGLEAFYAACGWQEIGRWPKALRFSPEDNRDEVLMLLTLHPGEQRPR